MIRTTCESTSGSLGGEAGWWPDTMSRWVCPESDWPISRRLERLIDGWVHWPYSQASKYPETSGRLRLNQEKRMCEIQELLQSEIRKFLAHAFAPRRA